MASCGGRIDLQRNQRGFPAQPRLGILPRNGSKSPQGESHAAHPHPGRRLWRFPADWPCSTRQRRGNSAGNSRGEGGATFATATFGGNGRTCESCHQDEARRRANSKTENCQATRCCRISSRFSRGSGQVITLEGQVQSCIKGGWLRRRRNSAVLTSLRSPRTWDDRQGQQVEIGAPRSERVADGPRSNEIASGISGAVQMRPVDHGQDAEAPTFGPQNPVTRAEGVKSPQVRCDAKNSCEQTRGLARYRRLGRWLRSWEVRHETFGMQSGRRPGFRDGVSGPFDVTRQRRSPFRRRHGSRADRR